MNKSMNKICIKAIFFQVSERDFRTGSQTQEQVLTKLCYLSCPGQKTSQHPFREPLGRNFYFTFDRSTEYVTGNGNTIKQWDKVINLKLLNKSNHKVTTNSTIFQNIKFKRKIVRFYLTLHILLH